MAKTLTKTKSASKTTSKTNGSFLSKLVPRSPKAKLIVFLVVFALIGGGVMAYRSFAASNGVSFYSDKMGYTGSAQKVTETTGIKRSTTVLAIYQNSAAGILPAYRPGVWLPKVSGCAFVRNDGPSDKSITITATDGKASTSRNVTLRGNQNEYVNYCTNDFNHTDAGAPINVTVKLNSGYSGTVNVGRLDVLYGTTSSGGGK